MIQDELTRLKLLQQTADYLSGQLQALVTGAVIDPIPVPPPPPPPPPPPISPTPPPVPVPIETEEEGIRVEFELMSETPGSNGLPQGALFVSPGLEVFGDFQAQSLYLKFHPTLDGVRLYKRDRGVGLSVPAPAQDGRWHRYAASCDLRTIEATVDGQPVLVANSQTTSSNVLYIGNSHNGWATEPRYTVAARENGQDKWNHNVKYRNISLTRFPVTHPGARYKFKTWIGNTSAPKHGQSVHAGFHPIHKMVSWGPWLFYHNGYDEGRHQLKRFHKDNPQAVTDRFGNGGRTLGPDKSGQPVDLAVNGDRLYVKKADGLVDCYHPQTLAVISIGQTFFPPDTSSTFGGVTATCDFVNHTVTVGNQIIGQHGGYAVNGPEVMPDKFGHYFIDGQKWLCGFACFQSDGKLWISDAATGRVIRFTLHASRFTPDGTVIQFIPHTSYVCAVDPNDPQRVFSRYLEFAYDYETTEWRLHKNWEPPFEWNMRGFMDGFLSVVTVGGKTLALVNHNNSSQRQLVELTANGIQRTAHVGLHSDWRLDPDGKATFWKNEGSTASFWTQDFKTHEIQIGRAMFRSPLWFVKRAGDRIISYAPQAAATGFRLASIQNNSWEWFAAPTGPFNGLGNFDPWCGHYDGAAWKYTYAGDMVPHVIVGNSVFIHHYGEFYRQSGQANQTLEYDLVTGRNEGQFGTMAFDFTDLAAPMSASNSKSIAAVQVNGKTYIFLGNEQSVGVQVVEKR